MEFAGQTEYNEGDVTTIINESEAADHKAFSRAPARARRPAAVVVGCVWQQTQPTTTAAGRLLHQRS